jgi:hydroxymethylpyrimidine pyrophosphatase-like HAD family hydrolase
VTGAAFDRLVTDLDGTLVDRQMRIVPRNTRALARFRDAGGTVVIATGRNEESASRYHAELGLDTRTILYNGARVVAPRRLRAPRRHRAVRRAVSGPVSTASPPSTHRVHDSADCLTHVAMP